MHGIILKGLKDFVTDAYDQETWNRIREAADVPRTLYVPVTNYPDEHVFALVEAAAAISGEAPSDLLRAFGRSVVPILVRTYGIHVDDEWASLDLIENVEAYIHQALRANSVSEFDPPSIEAKRVDDGTVVVEYDSERQLCDVAVGIVEGISDYYEEPLDVDERRCMHDGAASCELMVTRATAELGGRRKAPARADGGDDVG